MGKMGGIALKEANPKENTISGKGTENPSQKNNENEKVNSVPINN